MEIPVWILYAIIYPLLCFLFRNKDKYKWVPFAVVALFATIRFDLVSDYAHYYRMYDTIDNYGLETGMALYSIANGEHFEPGFILFSYAFTFLPYGWYIMSTLYVAILYWFVYKILAKYDVLILGTIFFVVFGYINLFDNVIRQALSVIIFIYSYERFYKENKPVQYVIAMLVAGFLHLSALYAILFYPLLKWWKRFDISAKTAFVCFSFAYVFTILDWGNLIIENALRVINYGYRDNDTFELGKADSGLGILLKTVIFYLPYLAYKQSPNINPSHKEIFNVYILYAILTIGLNNMGFMTRSLTYLFVFHILGFAISFKFYMFNKSNFKLISCAAMLYLLYMFGSSSYSYFGNYKYQTIFSENSRNERFYIRGNNALDKETDRNHYE